MSEPMSEPERMGRVMKEIQDLDTQLFLSDFQLEKIARYILTREAALKASYNLLSITADTMTKDLIRLQSIEAAAKAWWTLKNNESPFSSYPSTQLMDAEAHLAATLTTKGEGT